MDIEANVQKAEVARCPGVRLVGVHMQLQPLADVGIGGECAVGNAGTIVGHTEHQRRHVAGGRLQPGHGPADGIVAECADQRGERIEYTARVDRHFDHFGSGAIAVAQFSARWCVGGVARIELEAEVGDRPTRPVIGKAGLVGEAAAGIGEGIVGGIARAGDRVIAAVQLGGGGQRGLIGGVLQFRVQRPQPSGIEPHSRNRDKREDAHSIQRPDRAALIRGKPVEKRPAHHPVLLA